MKYTFFYTDGANYKTMFDYETDMELEVGQETTIEEIGLSPDKFYGAMTGSPYDDEIDHNIISVVKSYKDEEDTVKWLDETINAIIKLQNRIEYAHREIEIQVD